MSDYLTKLPTELIYRILDDVSTFDIFLSISLVNRRLRSVSLAYPRLQPNFDLVTASMNKNQFDSICTQLRRSISHVVSLTLFEKDEPMTPTKNALFFSRFCYIDSAFSNLRSLTLTYVNYDTWCLFKARLPLSIVTFSIDLIHTDTYANSSTISAILRELLLVSPSLKHLSLKMITSFKDIVKIRPQSPFMSSAIQYFRLEGVMIDLSSLFVVAPMIQTLEINFTDLKLTFNTIHPRPLHLQRLRIELSAIRWTEMASLLLSFPELTYLTVIADNLDSDMADGFAWAGLLTDIEHFEFKLQFHWSAFSRDPINLDSFRTKFWLEDKKWLVRYDGNLRNDWLILYSSSISIDTHPSDATIGILVSDSTGSKLLSFSHVDCLIINYQFLKRTLLNRQTHIKQWNFLQIPTTFKELVTYLDTSRMIKCNVSSEWISISRHELIKFLHNMPRLSALSVYGSILNSLFFNQWPDIVHLRIEHDFENDFPSLSSNTIDALCRSFINLKRLDIHSASIIDLSQLLNRMRMKLTELIIRQPDYGNNHQFITREYIEQNTELKNFHYVRDAMNSLYLWL